MADIRETSGAMNIAREAGRRTMAIGIFIKDRDMGSVVADMKTRVEKMSLSRVTTTSVGPVSLKIKNVP